MSDSARPAELGSGVYRAFQLEGSGRVNVVATGLTPTPGYDVWLEMKPIDVFPPQYELLWQAPDYPTPDVLTPFQVSVSFSAPQPVRSVTVHDAGGSQAVPVHPIKRYGTPELPHALAATAAEPNHFALRSGATVVTYTASTISGAPLLTYNRRGFMGSEITRTETPLGTLLTVVLEAEPDRAITRFSLFVPPVRIQSGAAIQVKLLGLTTVAPSSLGGPPPGQAMTYHADEFVGVANFIVS